MTGCGNQNENTSYVAAGRPGIALRLQGGGANSSSGTGMEGGSGRQMMRLSLRQAWNGQAATGVSNGLKIYLTNLGYLETIRFSKFRALGHIL